MSEQTIPIGAGFPVYQCHKKVRAAKIAEVTLHDPTDSDPPVEFSGGFMFFDGHAPIPFGVVFWEKHQPKKGGYLVIYEDGYISFSPAEAFEAGYTKLPESPKSELLTEARDAASRLNKLNAFMATDEFPKLDREDKDLLYLKQRTLSEYVQLLGKMLDRSKLQYTHQ